MSERTLSFGERLKRARKAKGLTALQLAMAMSTYPGQIYRLERDDSNPTLSTLEAIASALGMPLQELLSFR